MTVASTTGVGTSSAKGTRNPPALAVVGSHERFFWDGRDDKLEHAVLRAFTNRFEHGLDSAEDLLGRVNGIHAYRVAWASIEGETGIISLSGLGAALAAYVRHAPTRPSRFDRFWFQGDDSALSAEERMGLEIFRGAARCASCHRLDATAASFTDDDFHQGLQTTPVSALGEALWKVESLDAVETEALATREPAVSALGRYLVTRRLQDVGRFRTPTLREVGRSAPYFHDGSVASLEQAVAMEIYLHRHEGRMMEVSQAERAALVAFLRTLSAEP